MVKIFDKNRNEINIEQYDYSSLTHSERDKFHCVLEPGDILAGDEFSRNKARDDYGSGARYKIIDRINQGAQGHIYLAETVGEDELIENHITNEWKRLPEKVIVKGFNFSHINCATSLRSIDTEFRNVRNLGGYGYQDWFAFRRERDILRKELNQLYPGEFLNCYDTTSRITCEDGKERDLPFLGLVMDYFKSETLEEKLRKGSDFDREKTAEELLKKLMAIQSILVVHRDIKPPNILIGDNGLPQIIDYSLHTYTTIGKVRDISKESRKAAVETLKGGDDEYVFDVITAFLGNRLFSPPEVYQNKVDRRHDNWSMGLILYAMFTGEHLVPVNNQKTLDLREPVSLYWKRRYAGFLKRVSRGSGKKLQKVLDRRIAESPVPDRFKQVVRVLSMVNANERPYLRKVLAMAGIKPYKPVFSELTSDIVRFHAGAFWHRELNFY